MGSLCPYRPRSCSLLVLAVSPPRSRPRRLLCLGFPSFVVYSMSSWGCRVVVGFGGRRLVRHASVDCLVIVRFATSRWSCRVTVIVVGFARSSLDSSPCPGGFAARGLPVITLRLLRDLQAYRQLLAWVANLDSPCRVDVGLAALSLGQPCRRWGCCIDVGLAMSMLDWPRRRDRGRYDAVYWAPPLWRVVVVVALVNGGGGRCGRMLRWKVGCAV